VGVRGVVVGDGVLVAATLCVEGVGVDCGVGVGVGEAAVPIISSFRGSGHPKNKLENNSIEITIVRPTKVHARGNMNIRRSFAEVFEKDAKITSKNIRPNIPKMPKPATLRSLTNIIIKAKAAATPATPSAYFTAGTALIASLSTPSGLASEFVGLFIRRMWGQQCKGKVKPAFLLPVTIRLN
jgi:hypothetical protein